MHRGIFILLNFLLFASDVFAQPYVNPGVDTSRKDVQAALHFYDSYLGAFADGKQPDYRNYWSAEDCEAYKVPDPVVYGINFSIPTYALGSSPTIIYVKPSSGYIRIKTHFGWTDSTGNINTLAITNHYVRTGKSGLPEFVSPVTINARDWHTRTVRNVTFHFPAYHVFNKRKAGSLIRKITALEQEWALKPIAINFYFTDTQDEIQSLRGFDFNIGAGNAEKPSGISNDADNIIYCSGLGEDYFHEVVHVYLNRLFPASPMREGLAVFYGGSLGHELTWHLARMADYLDRHPEIDLNKPDDFWSMDNFTNPQSTIKGMLCLIAYRKDGLNGLKRVMSYADTPSILHEELGMKPDNFNAALRKLIRNSAAGR